MTVVDAMKYILFLLLTFSLHLVYGAETFSGFLTRTQNQFYFTPKSTTLVYQVEALNSDVLQSLSRLDSGDFLSGSGRLDPLQNKIHIQSVDYVGLQKLLGPWVSKDGTLVFKDFSTLRFLPRFRNFKLDSHLKKYQKEFHYSVSPKDSNEWALFMSDNTSTTFATVEFAVESAEQKIIMKIFESESGNIVRTLNLERP